MGMNYEALRCTGMLDRTRNIVVWPHETSWNPGLDEMAGPVMFVFVLLFLIPNPHINIYLRRSPSTPATVNHSKQIQWHLTTGQPPLASLATFLMYVRKRIIDRIDVFSTSSTDINDTHAFHCILAYPGCGLFFVWFGCIVLLIVYAVQLSMVQKSNAADHDLPKNRKVERQESSSSTASASSASSCSTSTIIPLSNYEHEKTQSSVQIHPEVQSARYAVIRAHSAVLKSLSQLDVAADRIAAMKDSMFADADTSAVAKTTTSSSKGMTTRTVDPFVMVLEQAHRYVTFFQRKNVSTTPCGELIRRIIMAWECLRQYRYRQYQQEYAEFQSLRQNGVSGLVLDAAYRKQQITAEQLCSCEKGMVLAQRLRVTASM